MPDLPSTLPRFGETEAPALAEQRRTLPEAPGVYQYLDDQGRIIYVGKATSLRKRVNSYFTKHTGQDYKTQALVRQIRDIRYTVTNDDFEALLLENSLIKQHQPKYNINLKDGKTYPYIRISGERFPRVFSTRTRVKDGSQYYGPYPSVATMNSILAFLREHYKLRTCSLNLSEKNIREGKFRPCLEYHIGRCLAPCVAMQPEEEYNEDIRQIRHILKGNFRELLEQLKDEMDTAVQKLDFERAHVLKKRIESVQKHRRRSTVVSEKVSDVEVLTLLGQEGLTVVHHFQVIHGTVVGAHSYQLRPRNDESPQEIMDAVLSQLLAQEGSLCPRILTNLDMHGTDWATRYHIETPERGDEKKVLQLSLENAQALLAEKLDILRLNKHANATPRLLAQAQQDLRLVGPPHHIECFDNSNIQGYAPVASCVVFREGKPSRRDYRVYNIKTVVGPDDFASMREVVGRRYRRLLAENQPLPDLIVIDGGKGQLSHALEALQELGLDTRVPIISIAKRLEEIYYKDDPVPLYIDKKSSTLRLLQRIRNEAHNTAITYHRRQRGKKTLKTELTEIDGVGAATAQKLLATFKSTRTLRTATEAELAQVIGPAKAQRVYAFLHPPEPPPATEPAPAPEQQRPVEPGLDDGERFWARRKRTVMDARPRRPKPGMVPPEGPTA